MGCRRAKRRGPARFPRDGSKSGLLYLSFCQAPTLFQADRRPSHGEQFISPPLSASLAPLPRGLECQPPSESVLVKTPARFDHGGKRIPPITLGVAMSWSCSFGKCERCAKMADLSDKGPSEQSDGAAADRAREATGLQEELGVE